MAAGVNHYSRDGKVHKGGTHKHPDGTVKTGRTMTKQSKKLYHFGDLNNAAQKKARSQWGT